MENTDLKIHFCNAVNAFREDPGFALPPVIRDLFAQKGQNTEVVLLGTTDFSRVFMRELRQMVNVVAVVDDFRAHKGFQFEELPIITSQEFVEQHGHESVIAVNGCRYDYSRRYFKNLCRRHGIHELNFEQAVRLAGIHCRDYRLDDWGDHITANVDAYLALLPRLADDESRSTLLSILLFHLTGNQEWRLHVTHPYSTLYFRSGLWSPGLNENFVDCGASIGESTTALLDVTNGNFNKIWMIEPDRFNIQTLERFISNIPSSPAIKLHACALGEKEDVLPFCHQGGHGGCLLPISEAHAPESQVSVMPLDKLIDDVPTLIKMDIEGAELAALKGGRALISEYRPKLCVSAYHRPEDILTITSYVNGVRDDYRIGLRHHTEDRWDTCLYFF
jgi:FkbM family methyltransferase